MITFLLVLAIIALSIAAPDVMIGSWLAWLVLPFPFWTIVAIAFAAALIFRGTPEVDIP